MQHLQISPFHVVFALRHHLLHNHITMSIYHKFGSIFYSNVQALPPDLVVETLWGLMNYHALRSNLHKELERTRTFLPTAAMFTSEGEGRCDRSGLFKKASKYMRTQLYVW